MPIRTKWLSSTQLPDAKNDSAWAALVGLDHGAGGFDDFEWADCFEPQLTVIAQPCEEIGRSAAKMLLEPIKKPDREPKTVRHKTELIIRNSCGC